MMFDTIRMFAALQAQADAEFARQAGFDLIEGQMRHFEDDGSRVDEDIIYLELPCACEC